MLATRPIRSTVARLMRAIATRKPSFRPSCPHSRIGNSPPGSMLPDRVDPLARVAGGGDRSTQPRSHGAGPHRGARASFGEEAARRGLATVAGAHARPPHREGGAAREIPAPPSRPGTDADLTP